MNTLRLIGSLFLLAFGATALAATDVYTTYYHNDVLGSPVAVTDENANRLWSESYYPFGERRYVAAGSAGNNIWFTGKELDDSGLTYLGARYYNAQVGRFMATDPISFNEGNPASFNRYAYANNNPHRYVDPNGESPIEVLTELLPAGIKSYTILAVYARGVYTDDVYLQNFALEVMREMTADNLYALASSVGPPGSGAANRTRRAANAVEDSGDVAKRGGSLANQTRSELLRSKRSFEEIIVEHREKLDAYRKNPLANDNKGTLRNAPEHLRPKIIQGRIKVLEKQLRKQEGELRKIIDLLGSD